MKDFLMLIDAEKGDSEIEKFKLVFLTKDRIKCEVSLVCIWGLDLSLIIWDFGLQNCLVPGVGSDDGDGVMAIRIG